MRWQPAVCKRSYGRTPPVGVLIGADRKIWRVVDVQPLSPGNWSERAAEEWVKWNRPDPWERAPMQVSVTPDGGGKRAGMTIEPWHYLTWHIVPEHYAVCSKCGEPAPCSEYEGQLFAERQMVQLEERMKVPAGFCPACSEPISTRQKVHHFPGPNLLNFLAPDGVTFHARGKCWGSAADYEDRWVLADPTRKRSNLTLRCKGYRVVHADGSAECFGAVESDCPGIYAHHNGSTSCVYQTHGCPRGCRKEDHRGIRMAKNLTKGGALQ